MEYTPQEFDRLESVKIESETIEAWQLGYREGFSDGFNDGLRFSLDEGIGLQSRSKKKKLHHKKVRIVKIYCTACVSTNFLPIFKTRRTKRTKRRGNLKCEKCGSSLTS